MVAISIGSFILHGQSLYKISKRRLCSHEHANDICNMKFKTIDLVKGWLASSQVPGKPVDWIIRDVRDSRNDLRCLANGLIHQLQDRVASKLPDVQIFLQGFSGDLLPNSRVFQGIFRFFPIHIPFCLLF